MSEQSLIVIGGGLAGLSAGCYARANGFAVTIVEHNLALGGVCTAWRRGPYLVDGCIHWLTGGPFARLYEELGIFPRVSVHPLSQFTTYRHAKEGWEVVIDANLDKTAASLTAISPEDREEIVRLVDAARHMPDVRPPVDRAPELAGLSGVLRDMWHLRHEVPALAHFRHPIGTWLDQRVKSARLHELFLRLAPGDTPTLFLLMILGYLERGWLSRPVGGTASFRDALVDQYRTLGGTAVFDATVDEIVVSNGRATGVRLTDGTVLDADVVISTSSVPETVFRLLAGRYGAKEWRARMQAWRTFQPIELATYGVALPLQGEPGMLTIDDVEPLVVGDFANTYLYLRIYNDDPAFAPPGHAIVQTLLQTDYDWWAKTGTNYQHEKDVAADRALDRIDEYLPGIKSNVKMIDVATPLTYWRTARSWRGAFEGWQPASSVFTHVSKQLPGLEAFYMAGQWVEPGGGVPMAIMSGRHVVELLCAHVGQPFVCETTAQASVAGH